MGFDCGFVCGCGRLFATDIGVTAALPLRDDPAAPLVSMQLQVRAKTKARRNSVISIARVMKKRGS